MPMQSLLNLLACHRRREKKRHANKERRESVFDTLVLVCSLVQRETTWSIKKALSFQLFTFSSCLNWRINWFIQQVNWLKHIIISNTTFYREGCVSVTLKLDIKCIDYNILQMRIVIWKCNWQVVMLIFLTNRSFKLVTGRGGSQDWTLAPGRTPNEHVQTSYWTKEPVRYEQIKSTERVGFFLSRFISNGC